MSASTILRKVVIYGVTTGSLDDRLARAENSIRFCRDKMLVLAGMAPHSRHINVDEVMDAVNETLDEYEEAAADRARYWLVKDALEYDPIGVEDSI